MTLANQMAKNGKESHPTISIMAEGSVRTLANGIFEKLRNEGCNSRDIISVSSHLLSLVTAELNKKASS